jgi:F-type H+-transporting ATPase subunit a
MFFFSPLEQFENTLLKPYIFGPFDLSINFFSLSLFFAFFVFFVFFSIMFSNPYIIPRPFQFVGESVYEFVFFVQKSQTGHKGRLFFPYFFSLFVFIFFSNFLGLIPYSFTPTAQIFIPFFFSFVSNFAFLIIGFYRYGFKFLKLFVPSGVSIFLIPLISVIEIITYLLRTFSLALRLFANIMAGHTLLFICVTSISLSFSLFSPILFVTTFFLVLAVYCLELLIAFLQAYVFIVLLSVYLVDAINQPGHLQASFLLSSYGVEYLVAHWAHNPVERVRSPPSSATDTTVPNCLSFFEVFIKGVE